LPGVGFAVEEDRFAPMNRKRSMYYCDENTLGTCSNVIYCVLKSEDHGRSECFDTLSTNGKKKTKIMCEALATLYIDVYATRYGRRSWQWGRCCG